MHQAAAHVTLTPDMIEERLKYKAPTREQVEAMGRISSLIVELGRAIGSECPEGIMKSAAVTDLTKLRMTINAAIIGDGTSPSAHLAGG